MRHILGLADSPDGNLPLVIREHFRLKSLQHGRLNHAGCSPSKYFCATRIGTASTAVNTTATAAATGQSVNAWLAHAVSRGLDNQPGRGPKSRPPFPPGKPGRPIVGKRYTGFARS